MKLSDLAKIAEKDNEYLCNQDLSEFYNQYVERLAGLEKIAENLNIEARHILGNVLQDIFSSEKCYKISKAYSEWVVKDSAIGISILVEDAPTLIKPYGTIAIKIARGSKHNIFRLIIKPKGYEKFPFIHEYRKHLTNFKEIKDIHDLKLVKSRKSKIFYMKNEFSKNSQNDISDYLISFNGVDIESSETGVRNLLEMLLDKAECLKN